MAFPDALKKGIFFTHKKGVGKNVQRFIEEIEKQLQLKSRSQFCKTDNEDYCLWLKPSTWWLKNLVRRSFLTMALRSGRNYKDGSLLDCFAEQKYGSKTVIAIKLFLDGYTFYTGKPLSYLEGWYSLFRNKDEEAVKKILANKYNRRYPQQAVTTTAGDDEDYDYYDY
jgi:hypothetical protein